MAAFGDIPADTTVVAFPPTGSFVGDSDTQSLTNKHVKKRVSLLTGTTGFVPDLASFDCIHVTAASVDLGISNPLNPANGDDLTIRIRDNGTQRNLTWDTQYRPISGGSLPATTTVGKTLYCLLRYNQTETKWDLLLTNLY